MSKRLQVLVDAKEYKQYQIFAKNERVTLGEWVRRSLRKAVFGQARKSSEEKLKAIRQAAQYNFPTADIDQMNAEILSGYLKETR